MMRDQYAGDLSDLIKIAYLRALAAHDRKLGVAWYYAPGDDGRADGRHIEHRAEQAWAELDPDLHGALANLANRSVKALESLLIWPPDTAFHGLPVQRGPREPWVLSMCKSMEGADIVFVDPDNGLGKNWEKHAYLEDLKALKCEGRALALITFPNRTHGFDAQIDTLHKTLQGAGFSNAVTLRTNVSVSARLGSGQLVQRGRFLTLVDADEELLTRLRSFKERLARLPRVTASVRDSDIGYSPSSEMGQQGSAQKDGSVSVARMTICKFNGRDMRIDEALRLRDKRRKQDPYPPFCCASCGEPVRPHKEGTTGQAAHFEHKPANDACPLMGGS